MNLEKRQGQFIFKRSIKSKLFILTGFFAVSFLLFAGINSAAAKTFNIFNSAVPTQSYFMVDGATGNVGIGTTTPGNLLHVDKAGANLAVIQIGHATAAELSSSQLLFGAGYSSGGVATWGNWTYTSPSAGTGLMVFNNRSAGTYSNVFAINGGSVGIGTTTPLDLLSIGPLFYLQKPTKK